MKEILRQLPAVNDLLQDKTLNESIEQFGYERVKNALQEEVDRRRQSLLNRVDVSVDVESIIRASIQSLYHLTQSSLQTVINATGTVLHTNLGRALLSDAAVEAMTSVAKQYNNLEYSLEQGLRGTRYEHIEQIIKELTGAESALLVNNNAAAVMLMLTTFTKGKEVLISRGELVEIGGAFRIPEVITSGGAILHEVGATNKTHLKDYQQGINDNTGAILRVHTSNYRLVGFTDNISHQELVELAHQNHLPAFNDLGSGLLIDLQYLGLSYEPTVKEMIDVGYDLVSFSGDKLLGGPQAGIIAGKKQYIDQLKKAPLLRALRSDKITIAALEATLKAYLHPQRAIQEIPTLNMIGIPLEDLYEKAKNLAELISDISGITGHIIEGHSQIGGGSYPGEYLPTYLVSIKHQQFTEAEIERRLRFNTPPIISRIHEGAVQFDVRTIQEEDMKIIRQALLEMTSEEDK